MFVRMYACFLISFNNSSDTSLVSNATTMIPVILVLSLRHPPRPEAFHILYPGYIILNESMNSIYLYSLHLVLQGYFCKVTSAIVRVLACMHVCMCVYVRVYFVLAGVYEMMYVGMEYTYPIYHNWLLLLFNKIYYFL